MIKIKITKISAHLVRRDIPEKKEKNRPGSSAHFSHPVNMMVMKMMMMAMMITCTMQALPPQQV